MKIGVFSSKKYDERFLGQENINFAHDLTFFKTRLTSETRFIAKGMPVVCVFVNDEINAEVLSTLAGGGTRLIALRCAGYNNVDLSAAHALGLTVVRVPAYSPTSVAEHTVALMLALARRLPRAYMRVREGNFELEGLLGFELGARTVGVIGSGKIGLAVARILKGFGASVLLSDPVEVPEASALGLEYVSHERLYAQSDIITLHCPLNEQTHHLINEQALSLMKDNVMLINTSRGAVIDTSAVITALKTRKIGYLGLDVYEQEGDLFFENLSNEIITDDVFERLLTFPNVLITGHQGFFTEEAMKTIAWTTLHNVSQFERGEALDNEVGLV